MYQLEYKSDTSAVASIVETVASFVVLWKPGVHLIVPVPPSRLRPSQPVLVLADALAKRLNLPCATSCVTRTREVSELKNVYGYDERTRLLAGVHTVDKAQVRGRKVLLE